MKLHSLGTWVGELYVLCVQRRVGYLKTMLKSVKVKVLNASTLDFLLYIDFEVR